MMNRKERKEKYSKVLEAMYVAGEKGDTNELIDKLGYEVRKKFGDNFPEGEKDEYLGIPANFNWEEAKEDFSDIFNNRALVEAEA